MLCILEKNSFWTRPKFCHLVNNGSAFQSLSCVSGHNRSRSDNTKGKIVKLPSKIEDVCGSLCILNIIFSEKNI